MDQVNVNETIRISARHFMLFGPGHCSEREKRSSECDWNLSGRDDNVERTKQALSRSVFFSVIKEFVAIFTRLERIHPINHVRMAPHSPFEYHSLRSRTWNQSNVAGLRLSFIQILSTDSSRVTKNKKLTSSRNLHLRAQVFVIEYFWCLYEKKKKWWWRRRWRLIMGW